MRMLNDRVRRLAERIYERVVVQPGIGHPGLSPLDLPKAAARSIDAAEAFDTAWRHALDGIEGLPEDQGAGDALHTDDDMSDAAMADFEVRR